MRKKTTLLSCLGGLVVAGGFVLEGKADEPAARPEGRGVLSAIADDTLNDIFFGPPESSIETATTVTDTELQVRDVDLDELFGVDDSKEVPVSKNTAPESTDSNSTDEGQQPNQPIGPSASTPSQTTSEKSGVTSSVESEEIKLTPQLTQLREKVRDCLGYYYNQKENVVDHSPWGVMHILIAYGVDTEVYYAGGKTNAIGYLCFNGNCRGQQLFYLNRGRIEARIGPGVQGHEGQFLAMLAQSKVKIDYPMNVEGKDLKIRDLIEYEKRTCEGGTELTFKLIGLAHYLDTDTKWKNQNGEDWSVSRLVKEELAQPIIGAACGGTHRLMGLNYAVRKREKEGKPMTGQFLRARKFLDDYFEYTFYLQNNDGSFSTDFFRGPNAYGDINLRLETTGHILEWFVASLSDEQLRDPRVIKGMDYLATLMLQNRRNEWEIGPKGHALHALAIYSERVFGDKPGIRENVLARGRKVSR